MTTTRVELPGVVWKDPDHPSLEEVKATIRELVKAGLVVDTGQRRYCEQSGQMEIVWAAVPPKHLRS
jgi:hypothetical protein